MYTHQHECDVVHGCGHVDSFRIDDRGKFRLDRCNQTAPARKSSSQGLVEGDQGRIAKDAG